MGLDFGIGEALFATAAAEGAAEAGTAAALGTGGLYAATGEGVAAGTSGLANAGFATSALGTGISAVGAINQAAATKANAQYQAEVARNNQIISEQNAQYASQAGNAATTAAQLKQRATTGAVAAGLAAEGLDINTGSPSAVRKSSAELTQLDTATTAEDAALKVYGFRTQGANYGASAGLLRQEAAQAGPAGLISGGGTFLSGVGGLANKWAGWQVANNNPALAGVS